MFIFRPVAYLAWNLWTVNGGRNQRVPLLHWSQDALNVYLTGKAALDGIGLLETAVRAENGATHLIRIEGSG